MKANLGIRIILEKYTVHDPELPEFDISVLEDIVRRALNQERRLFVCPKSHWATVKLEKITWE